jgi:hypothetical protein
MTKSYLNIKISHFQIPKLPILPLNVELKRYKLKVLRNAISKCEIIK